MKRLFNWFVHQVRVHDWPLYVATALVTLAATAAALELWKTDITVPYTYWGDAVATLDHFKTVLETGWFTYQPRLSAPYGQTYSDFPTAENLSFMAAGVFGFFTHNAVVSMNLYFIAGFIASALTALWLLRRLGVSRAISLVLSVLFALAPYHFIRGESHLFLASYYVVPLSIGILIAAIRGDSLWGRPARGARWYAWLTCQAAGTLLILILTATTETYYGVFFLILIAFAGLARLASSHNWRRFWGAAIAGGVTAFALVLNTLPSQIYSWVNGVNPTGLVRSRVDTEVYALKLTQLLLPWEGSRVPALAHIRHLYDQKYPLISENPALGAVAAAGLVLSLLVMGFVVASAGRSRFGSLRLQGRFTLLSQISALIFVAFLFSTIGGLSTIISFFTSSLRGWNRLAIYIAMLSLLAIGMLIDEVLRWLYRKANKGAALNSFIAALAAVLILTVGFIDQTPGDSGTTYASIIKTFKGDSRWFARVDKVLPPNAEVLQLPYQPFPEAVSITGTQTSDVIIPFLHTTDVRWSGGGIKGRPRADWPSMLEQYTPAQIVKLAAASGFDGIHIDRAALPAVAYTRLENGLSTALGFKPMVSQDKRFVFFDLQPLRHTIDASTSKTERRRITTAVTDPIILNTAGALGRVVDERGLVVSRVAGGAYAINVTSSRTSSTAATLTGEIQFTSTTPQMVSVVVTLPNGSKHTVPVVNNTALLSVPITVKTGVASLTVSITGANSNVSADFTSLYVEEPVVSSFLER